MQHGLLRKLNSYELSKNQDKADYKLNVKLILSLIFYL